MWEIIAGSFPEFIHPFAFSMIGIGLFSRTRVSRILMCTTFFLLNLFFEFGQKYKNAFTNIVPEWFSSIPIIDNTKAYFLNGTFAVEDLIAAALGSISAFICAELLSIKEGNIYETKNIDC